TLLESLTEARLDLASELSKDLRDRRAALSERLTRMQKSMAAAADRKAAEAELTRAEEEWEELLGEIRRRNPRYASFRYPEPAAVGVVRRLLGPETALVSYDIPSESVFVFVLTAGSFELLRLETSPRALFEQIENYVGLIARDDRDLWGDLSHRLCDLLVGSWPKRLPGVLRRLVMIAVGPLHSLPVAALSSGGAGPRLLA